MSVNSRSRLEGAPTFADRLKITTVLYVDRVLRCALAVVRHLLFGRFHAKGHDRKVRRILVYRIGNIGDIVAALPTLALVRARFADAHICLLTSPGKPGMPGARELVLPGQWFDSVLEYYSTDIATWQGIMGLLERLRKEKFDLFVELSNVIAPLHQVFRDLFFAKAIGCRFAAGFRPATVRWFPRVQMLHVPQRRESDRLYQSLAEELDLGPQTPVRLAVQAEEQSLVARKLSNVGVPEGAPFLVMHVGAKRETNRWFPSRFATVADEVHQRYGLRVIFTGGKGDRALVSEVTRYMRTQPGILCGELNLPQLTLLLEKASVYIGNDTGPMHIAAAVGTPTVAIFSARDFPEQWYPYGANHVVIREDVPCSPCFKEVCDRGLICLDRITVEKVLGAVHLQLARRGLQGSASGTGGRPPNSPADSTATGCVVR